MFRTGVDVTDSRAKGAAVEHWTALVVEHDAETMTLDQGAARLQEVGVAAAQALDFPEQRDKGRPCCERDLVVGSSTLRAHLQLGEPLW